METGKVLDARSFWRAISELSASIIPEVVFPLISRALYSYTGILTTHQNDLNESPCMIISSARPLQNAPFCPISVSGLNFNPQNTKCIPVVKIFAFLELEQN
jgi:hypothetical protein